MHLLATPSRDVVPHALPHRTVVHDADEQVVLVRANTLCRVCQALERRTDGFDAACQVRKARVHPVEEDASLQFSRFQRTGFDGTHENSAGTVAVQFNAYFPAPPVRLWTGVMSGTASSICKLVI